MKILITTQTAKCPIKIQHRKISNCGRQGICNRKQNKSIITPENNIESKSLLEEDLIKLCFADNAEIETRADAIMDFTEQNPFGTP